MAGPFKVSKFQEAAAAKHYPRLISGIGRDDVSWRELAEDTKRPVYDSMAAVTSRDWSSMKQRT
jgi:hypothetical protein